jgi:hypothetical protein
MSQSNTKFQLGVANSEKDIAGCQQVLEVVRREELNRVAGNSVFASQAMLGDRQDFTLIYCRDSETQEIIGCIRITSAESIAHLPASVEEYRLDILPKEYLSRLAILTRLAILPGYRGSKASLLLMMEAFKYHVTHGGIGALATCEPSLYSMYVKLGLRPIGHIHNSEKSGYRIPLLGFVDMAYFKSIRSPAMAFLRSIDEGKFASLRAWYYRQEERGSFDHLGIRQYNPQPEDVPLYVDLIHGLSEEVIEKITRNAMVISCKKGDVIIPDEDGGKFLGFVYEGELAVEKGARTLSKLSKGTLFGELAVITNDYRTARIRAASNAQVLILSKTALKMADVNDELALWKNMARIVAKKLLAMNAV